MRFNTNETPTKTVNLAGGEAYTESPELELVSILLTSFVQDQFYRSANKTMDRVAELIRSVDPMFAAKAALFARKEFHMRSITHVVAGELAGKVAGMKWAKEFVRQLVNRPDDMLEIASYIKGKNYKFPHAYKKGFAKALSALDEYRLAKYRGEGKAINMYDLVNLCHPKATPALTALMKGTLEAADTWEAKLSQAGQADTEEEVKSLKADAWESLLKENKLGYFALLRNLRNIKQQAPDCVKLACAQLIDIERIKKSKVLPFRFLTAFEELAPLGDRTIINSLSIALEASLQNVPHLPGKTLIAVDTSGSMKDNGGRPLRIASIFAAALYKSNDAMLLQFSEDAQYMGMNPADSAVTLASIIESKAMGGGTNFHSIFSRSTQPFDRVIILSDMQGWMGFNAPTKDFADYKRRTGSPNCRVFSFDLAGQGSLQFPENNVYALAGFSDKVFDIMGMLEQDRKALINKINSYEL